MRPATQDDLPAITNIYVRAYAQPPWNERNDPARSASYIQWVLTHPRTVCLVGLGPPPEEEVRGFILAGPRLYAEFLRDWEGMADRPAAGWPVIPGQLGYIWELAVEPLAQRQGLGQALLQTAVKQLQETGVDTVVLRSSERAPAAVGLYRKLGFERLTLFERRDPLAGPWKLVLAGPGSS